MTTAVEHVTGQGLVSEQLFNRLVDRIVKDENKNRKLAIRIVDQALAYLATCAKTTEPLSPSELVDIGWHTFILYTREYREFCGRIAGRFIDHEPNDVVETKTCESGEEIISNTVKIIRAAGYAVDEELWKMQTKCHQCTSGCTHSSGDTGCHHHPVRIDTVIV